MSLINQMLRDLAASPKKAFLNKRHLGFFSITLFSVGLFAGVLVAQKKWVYLKSKPSVVVSHATLDPPLKKELLPSPDMQVVPTALTGIALETQGEMTYLRLLL